MNIHRIALEGGNRRLSAHFSALRDVLILPEIGEREVILLKSAPASEGVLKSAPAS